MFLGKVIGDADSNEDSGDCNSRLKMVQKLDLYSNPSGPATIVVNFIGADDGDIVIVGSPSPGKSTAQHAETPDSIMIMGVLDNTQSVQARRTSAR